MQTGLEVEHFKALSKRLNLESLPEYHEMIEEYQQIMAKLIQPPTQEQYSD